MGRRPPHVKPPEHLSENPPVPEPDPVESATHDEQDPLGFDPTRYRDWTLKGIAVDF
jgi:hypothetical protein